KMLESRERIEIEVYNESEEISLERRQKFFEKKYSEKGRNRGYGLYNVKRICNEYGIEIICDNKEIDGKNCLVFTLKINKTL
ncbi:MAG: GHKL domain-containing protein, partial [Lachnospiraceae bacterium]|nr:GHKL domain-containing protein [Lachnospiraceae bacterium]